jgi:hypothetical protein
MKKKNLYYQNSAGGRRPERGRNWPAFRLRLAVAVLGWALLAWGCGEVRPLPKAIEPQDYTQITYDQLLAPGPAGLSAGRKIKVPAYFWQFLEYDPDMVRDYLNLARQPRRWYRLKWFALYGSPEMRGYYDRAALDRDRVRLYPLHRLEPVMVYGELSALGPGLYLRVHHLEKIQED